MPSRVLSFPESSWARSPVAELATDGAETPASDPVVDALGDRPLEEEGIFVMIGNAMNAW
jgi:hypothetical protein